ncbi:MAG TPA: potassium transporter KefC [Sedimenticola thiotaurini]|uniref:Potassium transporter KefC n=1 Tax=Sedimenticola thiotaurini TaxID=1543721 RepID=A0A831W6Z6_9GAMM|nr:potassium transporter KefC [Sedimenticola thiotaurini]
MSTAYLTDIVVLLAAAVVAVPLARAIGLGVVPGFLVAGIVMGPSMLGLIDNREEIAHLAEFGVVLLLFVIGIELKPARLWAMRRLVFGLGALQVLVTGALIGMVAHYLFGIDTRASILIGPALALSSTAFVLQLLTEQGMLESSYGRTSIAVLLFQDLAVVPLLILVSFLGATELTISEDIGFAVLEAVIILALIVAGGRYLLQPVLHRVARFGSPEVFTASAALLVLGTALLMERIGLSMAMGAFVAGLLVADSEYRHQIVAEIQPARGLLLGLFFMSMGMSMDLAGFFDRPFVSLGLVLLLMIGKALLIWPLARLFGSPSGTARATALLLAQSGEFALVLFAVAADSALLADGLFQQLLVVVVLSMLATPPVAALAHRLATARSRQPAGAMGEPPGGEAASARTMIIGFGRVGRRVGRILELCHQPYVALDIDVVTVDEARRAGKPVYYGDARQPEVLNSMGLDRMEQAVVTVDDYGVAEQLVAGLHRDHPDLRILARGRDLDHCRLLRRSGAAVTVSENLEASIALAQGVLTQLEVGQEEAERMIEQFRETYYRQHTDQSTQAGGDDGNRV